MQRALRCGASKTGGISPWLHAASARLQRGAKEQPDGRQSSRGGARNRFKPGAAARPVDRRCQKPAGVGVRQTLDHVVQRTRLDDAPRYITAIRSEISTATPMSWVTKITAMPIWRWRSHRRSRIWIWTVASNAVVGSSASRTLGRWIERIKALFAPPPRPALQRPRRQPPPRWQRGLRPQPAAAAPPERPARRSAAQRGLGKRLGMG